MADTLYQSELTGTVFSVISHRDFFFFFFNYCSVLGNAASDWSAESFSLALTLKTTKFTNFHRPHSVFTDFQGLEKIIPFSQNFQRPSKSMRTLLERMRTCAACAMFYYIIRFYGYYIIRFYGRLCKVHNGLIKLDLVTAVSYTHLTLPTSVAV